jgi:hypothetical protein
MTNTTYAYDTSSQSDPAAIASYAYRSSLQSAQSIQVNASLSPVMDGHDKGSFELAGSVALIVAFTALIILMLRKRKHNSRRCYY